MSYYSIIGIDTGVKTGVAAWLPAEKKFVKIATMPIHQALAYVQNIFIYTRGHEMGIHVIVEDARQVRFRGKKTTQVQWDAMQQGVGSIKRDAKIWEDFLTDLGIPHTMARPNKALTKYNAKYFKALTGWEERTSEHARDAAMMVYGLKKPPL